MGHMRPDHKITKKKKKQAGGVVQLVERMEIALSSMEPVHKTSVLVLAFKAEDMILRLVSDT